MSHGKEAGKGAPVDDPPLGDVQSATISSSSSSASPGKRSLARASYADRVWPARSPLKGLNSLRSSHDFSDEDSRRRGRAHSIEPGPGGDGLCAQGCLDAQVQEDWQTIPRPAENVTGDLSLSSWNELEALRQDLVELRERMHAREQDAGAWRHEADEGVRLAEELRTMVVSRELELQQSEKERELLAFSLADSQRALQEARADMRQAKKLAKGLPVLQSDHKSARQEVKHLMGLVAELKERNEVLTKQIRCHRRRATEQRQRSASDESEAVRALQEQMADATRSWADERRALVRDQQAKTNELQREAAVRQETLIQALEVADGQAEAARRELWLANQQAHVSTSLVSCRVCVSVSVSVSVSASVSVVRCPWCLVRGLVVLWSSP